MFLFQKDHEEKFKTVYINPIELLPLNSHYYMYSGSLTTPPCSENVNWIVMKKTIEASAKEIQLFKEKVKSFNTKIQPLNKRKIYQSK